MLPSKHRMRRSTEFATAVRTGKRARRGVLVVHERQDPGGHPVHVGLVVGRTVGNSVVRHQVSRRLRAQLAQRLERLPLGTSLVVRALPDAATATSRELGRDLDLAFERLGH